MAGQAGWPFVERLFNHIVLPPQLPSHQDADLDSLGYDIIDCVQRACNELRNTSGGDICDTWIMLEESVFLFSTMNGRRRTDFSMSQAFKRLQDEKTVVAFYIEEQNAALLVHFVTEYVASILTFFRSQTKINDKS